MELNKIVSCLPSAFLLNAIRTKSVFVFKQSPLLKQLPITINNRTNRKYFTVFFNWRKYTGCFKMPCRLNAIA
jgi:hypothetical protein